MTSSRAWLLGLAGAACCLLVGAGAALRAAENLNDLDAVMPKASPMPAMPPVEGAAANMPVMGNPLWGIRIESLHATRERPIFSRSRRPYRPVMPAGPPRQVKAAPSPRSPRPPQPERPAVNLVGVIVGNGEGYAVFVKNTAHAVVRLKVGDGDDGWILRSVAAREAVLEKNNRTVVMRLPAIGMDAVRMAK